MRMKISWNRKMATGVTTALMTTVVGLIAYGEFEESMGAAETSTQQEDIDGPNRFGFGKPATHEEIEAWDIDVMVDGSGLPPGQGDAEFGADVYRQQCASCHGQNGEGSTAEALVGTIPGQISPFGPRYEAWRENREDVPFTVGNYWPYATTLFDYIRRSMPRTAPGSLSADQVYSLVAWLLVKNDIISDDVVLNAKTLPLVEMPARAIFKPDDRIGGPEVK